LESPFEDWPVGSRVCRPFAALAKPDFAKMKADVTAALVFLKTAVHAENIWLHWSFDPAKIAG
jgi:hypothetical protein